MPQTLPHARSVDLKSLIKDELPELVAIRHDLHRHPELSFEERRTAALVARELADLSIETKTGLAKGTGVIGYLPPTLASGAKRPTIALRADMDALPIAEHTGKPYASIHPGVMHACGHDGHTAILLGVARVLARLERPNGVLLLFQPAEEQGGGADEMCKQGALAGASAGGLGNPVGRVFGLHGWPNLPFGRVATRAGSLMAAVDDFEVIVHGTPAHAAYPQVGRDCILATAAIVQNLQSIASRNVGPLDSVVCTVGAVHAGTANNIIPEQARFIGTVRTLKAQTRALARERFFEIVEKTAAAHACRAEIRWMEGYPVVVNDEQATAEFFEVATRALGRAKVDVLEHPTMGGEDFAYYARHAGACFFFIGTKPPGASDYPQLHQPEFDFNDEIIPHAVELMSLLALREPAAG